MKNTNEVITKVLLELFDKLKHNDLRYNTVEKLNVHLEFDPTEEYIDYGDIKPASRKYIQNELNWYLSQDPSIIGHQGIENNPIWKHCGTMTEGKVNSNYGKIVYEKLHDNKSQIEYAVEKLISDKFTRQSIIIYTRSSLHWEYNDNIHANNDFTCTTHTQHFINNNDELIYIVNMRSNDVIFGLQNDYSWHRYVYYNMFKRLKEQYKNLKVGKIYWNVGSMHLYDIHFDLLKDIVNEYNKQGENENDREG